MSKESDYKLAVKTLLSRIPGLTIEIDCNICNRFYYKGAEFMSYVYPDSLFLYMAMGKDQDIVVGDINLSDPDMKDKVKTLLDEAAPDLY